MAGLKVKAAAAAPPTQEEEAFLQIVAPIAAAMLSRQDPSVVRDAAATEEGARGIAARAVQMAWFLVDEIRKG